MLTISKNRKKDSRKLLFSPVFAQEILGAIYRTGEILPHARMRILVDTSVMLAGLAYKNEETLYFVASHPKVIEHIRHQGCVPLIQSENLRFFKNKKRMNSYLIKAKVAV